MTLLILHPELVFVACFAAVLALSPPPRRFWIGASIALIFLPIWPILIVRLIAVWAVDLCDWLTVDRFYTRPLSRAANFLMTKW